MLRAASTGPLPSRIIGRIVLALCVAVLLVLAAAIIIVLAAPNVLRSPLSHYLSARLDRHLAINGDLEVHLVPALTFEANGITLDNVPNAPQPHLFELERIRVTVNKGALLRGHLVLDQVALAHPLLWLGREKDGAVNWNLGHPGLRSQQAALPVRNLIIDQGSIDYRDALIDTQAVIDIASTQSDGSRTSISFNGKGRLHDQSLALTGRIAAPADVSDNAKSYAVSFQLSARDGTLAFRGGFVPFDLQHIEGDVTARGRDLSDLYPALPIPLPWTPAYRLRGHLVRNVNVWELRDLKGSMGESDISGAASMDLASGTGRPPYLRATLLSHALRISDLGGLVGLPPSDLPPSRKPPEQALAQQQRAASPKALPQKPMHLEQLGSIEADVEYTGEHIQATTSIPLDNLHVAAHLHHGVLALQPLAFGLAGGQVEADIGMDTSSSPRLRADIKVKNVEAERLLTVAAPPKAGTIGKIGGAAHAEATGASVAEMLGSVNGRLGLIMWGGQASTLALVATNLDLARVAALIISGDRKSTVRCAMGAFEAKDGTLWVQQGVIDTSAVRVDVTGQANFKTEQWDIHVDPTEKKPSPLALRGPLNIGGTFKDPSITPGLKNIAARTGAAIALGMVNPLLSLLPLIDFGGGKDADCRALGRTAESAASSPPP